MIKTLYKKFQSWSEKGSVYIMSDPHFLDTDMNWRAELLGIHFMDDPDPIEAAEAIADSIVYRINHFVHKNDTLVLLGDIGDVSYIKRLKAGYKVLIKGNHDVGTSKYEENFDEVSDHIFVAEKILLSHEPIMDSRWLNIHGHVHNTEGKYDNAFNELNVSCEVINFTPVSLSNIIKSGALNKVDSVHRDTIDHAIERKKDK